MEELTSVFPDVFKKKKQRGSNQQHKTSPSYDVFSESESGFYEPSSPSPY
jgi:hypothetical protein